MMASVGAVSERPVEVFVSMNAILAFAKGMRRRKRAITEVNSPSCSRKSMHRMP